MSASILTATQCFNFVVVGPQRSGSAALSSALCGLPGTHVHVGLLDRSEKVREHAVRSYFGVDEDNLDPDNPPWFKDGVTNPYHYMLSQVFDQPRRDEARIGLRMDYTFAQKYQIHDTVEELHRRGDFCVVHVRRNPIASFVSLKQAQKTGVWGRMASSADTAPVPAAVRIDPKELTAFVREHQVEEQKIRQSCDDAIVIEFRDLCLDFEHQVRRVAAYIEAPCPRVTMPCVRRMRNKDVMRRIYNLDEVVSSVPSDVRAAIRSSDLY